MSDTTENQWFGYRHIDGTLHAKRFFDHRDIMEAEESLFVDRVVPVFSAKDTWSAMEYIQTFINEG